MKQECNTHDSPHLLIAYSSSKQLRGQLQQLLSAKTIMHPTKQKLLICNVFINTVPVCMKLTTNFYGAQSEDKLQHP